MVISSENLPSWFREYPEEYLVLIEQELIDFTPWIILNGDRLKTRIAGVQNRYGYRKLLPFARREDNDDVACWEDDNSNVVIIHDFATKGYEGGKISMRFWDWFRQCIEDMIEYNS